jgi:hypothetical protein
MCFFRSDIRSDIRSDTDAGQAFASINLGIRGTASYNLS